MIITLRPADYSEGYGELVRSYRMYLGVSQRTLAEKIGISERSLSDIEVGRRRCPTGFINSVEKVVDEYDQAVDALIEATPADNGEKVIEVSDDPRREWVRAVVGRAAVTKGVIRPVLASQHHP